MYKFLLTLMLVFLPLFANEPSYPVAKVSFADYQQLVREVEGHRAERLIDFDTFLEMSNKPGVVVLDTRSKNRYDRLHLKGSVHLNFSDFTQEQLREIIPDPETIVLIYCNNNFEGNQIDFTSKMVDVVALPASNRLSTRREGDEAPVMMALNIPTYVNLYGYGYRNVYELHELVDVNDPRVAFEGSEARR